MFTSGRETPLALPIMSTPQPQSLRHWFLRRSHTRDRSVVWLAMWLPLLTGCLPLPHSANLVEHVLVDRTGQGLQESDNPAHESTTTAEDSANAVPSAVPSPTRSPGPPVDSGTDQVGRTQLLEEMLNRTDDPLFREQLLNLREESEARTSTEINGPARISSQPESIPATSDRAAVHRQSPVSPPTQNFGTASESRPPDFANVSSPAQEHPSSSRRLPDNSLRSIQVTPEDFQTPQAIQPVATQEATISSAESGNRQSMQVEVVTSADSPKSMEPSDPNATSAAVAKIQAENRELREQLQQAAQRQREMAAVAAAAMSPNAGFPGAAKGGMASGAGLGAEPSAILASMGGMGGNHAMLEQMLTSNLQQQVSAEMTQFDRAVDIPPFDLAGSQPIGSAVTQEAKANSETVPSDSAPIAPGQWKTDLTAATRSLRRSLVQTTDQGERQTLEVYLRLLELISSDHDAAVRTIESLPPEMQDFWRHQLFALSQITRRPEQQQDALFVNNSRRATKTLGHLRDAMSSLQSVASLRLSHLTFCDQVRSFGDYDIATATTVSSGDPLLVYCEVENYSARRQAGTQGERFLTRLSPSYAIYNDQRQIVFQEDYPVVEDQCKTLRQDFFLTLQLQLPTSLTTGRYHLVISVEDLEGSKIATGTPLTFHVR